MKLALTSILLFTSQFSGQTAHEPPVHFAGCYKLIIVSRIGNLGDFPRRFELATDSLGTTPGDSAGEFVIRTLDSGSGAKWPFSFWTITHHGSLEIDWGTGFVGYHVTLREVGHRLVGTVKYWSDDGEPSIPASVEARRLSCGERLQKSK